MKLITEYTESSLECLVEKKRMEEKDYSIQGIFAQTNKKNQMVVYIQEIQWNKRLQNTTRTNSN